MTIKYNTRSGEYGMKCPRDKCKNEAINHRRFGILPCRSCQESNKIVAKRRYEFGNLRKIDRVQTQRDHHGADMLQPYDRGKANPDFFKQYPETVESYGVKKELEKT